MACILVYHVIASAIFFLASFVSEFARELMRDKAMPSHLHRALRSTNWQKLRI